MVEEVRKMKLMINKVGGTAGKGSLNYRVSLPTKWIRQMKLNEVERNLKLTFDGKKIIIEKDKEDFIG